MPMSEEKKIGNDCYPVLEEYRSNYNSRAKPPKKLSKSGFGHPYIQSHERYNTS